MYHYRFQCQPTAKEMPNFPSDWELNPERSFTFLQNTESEICHRKELCCIRQTEFNNRQGDHYKKGAMAYNLSYKNKAGNLGSGPVPITHNSNSQA